MTNTTKPTVDDLADTGCGISISQEAAERCKPKFAQPDFKGFPRFPGEACDACAEGPRCRRIGQCLRYKCEFGKVDKP